MAEADPDAISAELAAEEAGLRERLRALEALIHDRLKRDLEGNMKKIEEVERELRAIVLRLVQIEREQIELRIAREL